jgi:hypothetical protein
VIPRDADSSGGAGRPGDEEPIRVSLVFDLDNQALGITVEPPRYPLSRLLSALPPEAGEVLGWLPDLAVAEAGVLVDPRNGAAGVFATAGLPDSAQPSATLFLAEVRAPTAQDRNAAPTKLALLLGLTLDSPITLDRTPLFGALLEGLALEDLTVTWASAAIPAGTVILPRPAPPRVDQPAYAKGPELSLVVREGANREPLRLRPPARGTPPPRAPGAAIPAADAADAAQLPDPLAGPPVQWFPVEKRLGPLTIARIGVVGTQTAFGLALDASLRTASLGVRLTGFTVVFDPRSDIRPGTVKVMLDGLAVAFGSGKLKIDGGLVRTTEQTDDGPVTAYAGALTIQAGPYGIAAIGSYAEYRGAPSMFVFGLARGRFGGVPAFFVTGLAAGFGYNRRLRLPAIEQVRDFPLVRAVLARPPTSGRARADPPSTNAGSALAELSEGGWVPIASGAYWVAAGIAFTSFGVLDGFVMLVVQFGERFIISLLGVLGLRLPKLGPAVAYVELAIDAVLDVELGEFRANALLTPNSFVFNRDGRLSGGFAFRLWFGAHPNAGDFVVTIGGYHPAFARPQWYPEVPRLAINWRVSPEIGISGNAYVAITPSAGMAGGHLDVRFAAGALRAWFIAHADLIIYWRPVFFEVDISVSVGAEYTLSLGSIHRTLTIQLGAKLQLWGPPFTGVAHVRWTVISFSVAINGGRRPDLPGRVLNWEQFAADFLPADSTAAADASPVCLPRAAAGLMDALPVGERQEWLVNGGSFALLTETSIPASRLEVEGPVRPGPVFDFPRVGVYPMGSLVVETPHRVKISLLRDAADREVLDLSGWTWSAEPGQAPYAVWGTQNSGRAELGSRLLPVATGLRGTPPSPDPAGPPPVPLGLLDSMLIDPRRGFRLPPGEIDGSTPPPPPDPRTVVRDTVDHEDVVRKRGEVTDLLVRSGIAPGVSAGRMNVLAERVMDAFPAAPMLGPPGTTGPLRVTEGARGRASAPAAPGPALRSSITQGARTGSRRRLIPVELSAIYFWHDRSRGLRGLTGRGPAAARDPWTMTSPYSLRAHVYDRFADAGDEAIAARHLARRGAHAAFRIDEGVLLLWAPDAADRGRAVESDGGLGLRVTQFDPQGQVLRETRLAPGDEARARMSDNCELLLLAADDDPGPVRGWTAATTLAQLAPQALLGPGVVVRPQSPLRVATGGVRGTRAAGLTSGRVLAEANRVETPGGTGPGWIDTLFAEPPAWLRITLRPQGEARRGSGPHGEPASVEVRAADGHRLALTPVLARGADGLLQLSYRVPDGQGTQGLTVRVQPDPRWYADAVVGVPEAVTEDRGGPAARPRPGNPDRRSATVVLR